MRVRQSTASSTRHSEDWMLTLVTLDRYLQVNALARLFTAVALDMRGAILAHGPTVLTLRNRPPLFVDVLEWTICSRTAQN